MAGLHQAPGAPRHCLLDPATRDGAGAASRHVGLWQAPGSRPGLLVALTLAQLLACSPWSPASADTKTDDRPVTVKADDRRVAVQTVVAPTAELAVQTDRVIIFKDGHGLFVKQARGTADAAGRVYTEDVPDAAVLGSFWATSNDDIVAMRAEWVEDRQVRTRPQVATTMVELLRANEGRSVTLSLREAGSVPLAARIVKVLEVAPTMDEIPAVEAESVVPLRPTGGAYVLLDVDGRQRAMPVTDINSIESDNVETDIELREAVVKRTKRLVFDLGAGRAGDEVVLNIIYFRPGVRWIPTYRLEDASEGPVELALQGELLNEAEDIIAADVQLVVGVPNFRFKTVASPLTLEATLRQTLAHAAPDVMGRGNSLSNALYTQRSSEWDGGHDFASNDYDVGGIDMEGGLSGESHKDLFVYKAGRFTLKKGDRATLPLWTSSAAKKDLFTYDVDVVRHGQMSYGSAYGYGGVMPGQGSPLELARNEVWRQFELENRTGVPWTTGAALLLRGHVPLAQELLTYTPVGGRTLIPVTVAVDIRSSYEEEELRRVPNALTLDGDEYMAITKKGEVTLTNFRDERATVRVRLRTGGRAESATDEARVDHGDWLSSDWASVGSPASNGHSQVVWEIAIEPGESKSLTTEIVYYVR